MISETELLRDLSCYENDFKWFLRESENLKEKFRGKVILIKDKDVKAFGNNVEEVKEKASKLKIDIEKAVVQFIPSEDITLII